MGEEASCLSEIPALAVGCESFEELIEKKGHVLMHVSIHERKSVNAL
jgi:hypothetical protein